MGTGPFVFKEWKKGQYIRLDKNENYWGSKGPYLDRIVGRFVPDASTRTAAMENGEVLYAAYNAIPNIDAVRLKERDDIDVTTDGYSMINPMALIEFNTKEGPFVDAAVRRAISTAIDRKFMIETIFFGYGKPATSALSSNFGATGLHYKMPNYPASGDIAAANKMLDEIFDIMKQKCKGKYFIHNLVFYKGQQRYGLDYFSSLDQFIEFCPFKLLGKTISAYEESDCSETSSIFRI